MRELIHSLRQILAILASVDILLSRFNINEKGCSITRCPLTALQNPHLSI